APLRGLAASTAPGAGLARRCGGAAHRQPCRLLAPFCVVDRERLLDRGGPSAPGRLAVVVVLAARLAAPPAPGLHGPGGFSAGQRGRLPADPPGTDPGLPGPAPPRPAGCVGLRLGGD